MGSDSDPSGDSAAIFSGHPHISIVTVYRNTCWMRIPSLGLVKGDIIALMAGDITPGKVHELLPEENLRKNTLLQDPTYSVEDIEKEIRKNIDENDRNDNNETNNDKKSFEIDAYEEENIYQINNNSTKIVFDEYDVTLKAQVEKNLQPSNCVELAAPQVAARRARHARRGPGAARPRRGVRRGPEPLCDRHRALPADHRLAARLGHS